MAVDAGDIRIFFALPADDMRDGLRPVHERLCGFSRVLRAVAPLNYHVTLKFLGATPRDRCDRLIGDFLSLDLGPPAPLPCTVRGLGAFPNAARPRIIWCGCEFDQAVFGRILSAIEGVTSSHGFPREERPFHPHLTLARVRREVKAPPELSAYIASQKDVHYGEWACNRIVLYRSDLGREGPGGYTVLAERTLGDST